MSCMIGACRIEKVWESRLRENYVSIVGDVAPRELPAVVKGLEVHFAKHTPAERLVECSVCGGWSDEVLPGCPYCSSEDEQSGHATPCEPAPAAPPAPSTMVDKATTTTTSAPALAHSQDACALTDEAVLDKKVAEFKEKIRASASSYGEACIVAKEIHDRHWQQRTAGGKPVYKTFAQFAKAELGLGHTQVYAMIEIAEKGLADDAASFGLRFAKLLAAAPDAAREGLRDLKKSGAPNRQLEATVIDIRDRMREKASADPGEKAQLTSPEGTFPSLPRSRGQQKTEKQRERETREACAKAVAENADPNWGTIFVPRKAKGTFAPDERTGGWLAELPGKSGTNKLVVLVRMNLHGDEPETIEFQVIERDEEEES